MVIISSKWSILEVVAALHSLPNHAPNMQEASEADHWLEIDKAKREIRYELLRSVA